MEIGCGLLHANLSPLLRERSDRAAIRVRGSSEEFEFECEFSMTALLTNLFDGVAYGMLLFVLACGLAVTLGLMNFVNLAHGAFAMAGGYVCAVLVNRFGWPFFAGLPLAFISAAVIGAALERLLYRHLDQRSHLDQVLFSIGLTFMSVAAVDYIMGSQRIFINLPSVLEGQFDVFGVGIGRYRLMIIVICGLAYRGSPS